MPTPSVFGQIPGAEVGSTFSSRSELRRRGLHRHEMAGISGDSAEGADAIVISGGYRDDVDSGDWILYTGQGGRDGNRQVSDQTLTRGNKGLARSEELGLPVRVIRGAVRGSAHAPTSGYRYDGLYRVARHWRARSHDGPYIYRYELERLDAPEEFTRPTRPRSKPTGVLDPDRTSGAIQRIVRNTAVSRWVKEQHRDMCQFCGIALELDLGRYSEGAHIQALGAPHYGPDSTENVLCLCPNDHVLFDKGARYLDDDLHIRRTSNDEDLGSLRSTPDHRIDVEHVRYHREHFAGIGG